MVCINEHENVGKKWIFLYFISWYIFFIHLPLTSFCTYPFSDEFQFYQTNKMFIYSLTLKLQIFSNHWKTCEPKPPGSNRAGKSWLFRRSAAVTRAVLLITSPESHSLHQMHMFKSLAPGNHGLWGYTSPEIHSLHQMHTFKSLAPGNQGLWGYTSPEIHSLHQMHMIKYKQ
jgi:hypothetical protein